MSRAPDWAFEPASFDFGNLPPGQSAPAPAPLKLVNTGEVPLFPTVVALTPADDFGLAANGCRSWLAPGGSCTVEVTFKPRSSGRKEATLGVAAWEETAPPTCGSPDRRRGAADPGDLAISDVEVFTADSPQVIRVSGSVQATRTRGGSNAASTNDAFHRCTSPARYRGLMPGRHRFWVRPVRVHFFTVLGPAATYEWRILTGRRPKP